MSDIEALREGIEKATQGKATVDLILEDQSRITIGSARVLIDNKGMFSMTVEGRPVLLHITDMFAVMKVGESSLTFDLRHIVVFDMDEFE